MVDVPTLNTYLTQADVSATFSEIIIAVEVFWRSCTEKWLYVLANIFRFLHK
jgi:hypothetical protein